MEFRSIDRKYSQELADLFRSCFTSSEGEAEGESIAALAAELAESIDDESVFCFVAIESDAAVGAIFFSKLTFESPARVYMLSPVAVLTSRQGQGIGKKLIEFGLNSMRARGAEIAVTYGDPDFYGDVGFLSLSEDCLKAPMKLSMPFGWLGQSLTASPIPVFKDRPTCVTAFKNPAYW
ncbi:N-acetyltransferase [Synechococcus sp. Cruz-9H2]|uniref:GNAT family N-acetyltransferase n=1 Tax=unclassified Synechococcus TaxID=2626047 RepID=UPI0020CBB484|nr:MULTISPECIES: N-acetyltransferase [unclassified Synechococcus]MCP9821019.1 N-acetyltransferase [Synechococcus sp. Cruz-9H2]MCP9845260.1 N-acetyltransferase [Synechococcus sp. Edmonson 11F2]MCP9857225.1 N-acetyltransferase [Synechococcus sp. Cruz-9C9]MCP9864510.1 N-acetyltransferase [Synechococcus sp. Cruz-7E5]MCP9871779.1 N-acetyltransferase [Synechococcus sp. Cruz-7B9]